MNYNTNLACGSMSPVTALSPNDKGFYDVFGNAWEWTLDYFCALPGFQVHPHYEDFSTPCFDGLHHVIQAGSFMSTGNEASAHSRFHFRPHFYQHASFRLVEQQQQDPSTGVGALVTSDTDAPGPYVGSYPFRRSNQSMQDMVKLSAEHLKISQQNITLLKHFHCHPPSSSSSSSDEQHDDDDVRGSAMQQLGRSILHQLRQSPFDFKWEAAHLLEVGCGPGGLLFSLAQDLHHDATTTMGTGGGGGGGVGMKSISMIGIDHDAELISIAHQLLAGKTVTSTLAAEGDMSSIIPISIPKVITTDDDDGPLMIYFRTADPMCLPAEMSNFDCVVLNDVIDKVSSPNSVLGRLGGARGLVRPGGGILVTCSTYQWKEETTPRGLWLGGYRDATNGVMVQSRDTLIDRLSPDFTLLASYPLKLSWTTSAFERTSRHYDVNFFVRK
jgi:SAM-dependent methyltransferase